MKVESNKKIKNIILENGLMVPIKSVNFTDDLDTKNFLKDYSSSDKETDLIINNKLIVDERINEMIKLNYELEIEHNIRYEISRFLQQKENKKIKDNIIKLLDGVKDLLYTKLVRKELFDIFYDIVYNNLSWSIDRESKYWDRIIKQYNPVKFRIVGSDLNDDKDSCNSNPFYEYFDGKPGILQRVVEFIGGAKKPVAEEDMCYAISKSTNTIKRCMTEVKNKNRDENPHHLCGKHFNEFKRNGGYLQYGYWINPMTNERATLDLFDRKLKTEFRKSKSYYDELFSDGYDIKKINWNNYITKGFDWEKIDEFIKDGGKIPNEFEKIITLFLKGDCKKCGENKWFKIENYDTQPVPLPEYLLNKTKTPKLTKVGFKNIIEKSSVEELKKYPFTPSLFLDLEAEEDETEPTEIAAAAPELPAPVDKPKKVKKAKKTKKVKNFNKTKNVIKKLKVKLDKAGLKKEKTKETSKPKETEIKEKDVLPKDGPSSGKKGCYMVIPKQNLLYPNIKENLKNKLYRLVDETIRNKNRQIELIDGLVPKSVLNDKFIPLDKNEIIVTESNIMDDQFINDLYKNYTVKNYRVNIYGNPIDTVDFTNPESIKKVTKSKLIKALTVVQVSNKTTPCKIKETGNKLILF